VTASLGQPVLRRFSAYLTGAAPPVTWQHAAAVWADDEVGSWVAGSFDVDLTAKIDAAAQYRVRLVGRGGGAPEPREVELLLNEVPAPALLRAEPGRTDVLILTIPGLGQPIRLRGRVVGSSAGIILLRRL
jgi:hypothetical protein